FHSAKRRADWSKSFCALRAGATRHVKQISDKSLKKSRCQLMSDIWRLSARRTLVASLIWLLQRYCSAARTTTTIAVGMTRAAVRARSLIGHFISLLTRVFAAAHFYGLNLYPIPCT